MFSNFQEENTLNKIQTNSTEPFTPSIETITPKKATDLLTLNHSKNRPLDKKLVEEYANKMRKGDWDKYSRYIELNQDGKLINGQHRLAAIKASGKPQTFVIMTNVPNECSYSYMGDIINV